MESQIWNPTFKNYSSLIKTDNLDVLNDLILFCTLGMFSSLCTIVAYIGWYMCQSRHVQQLKGTRNLGCESGKGVCYNTSWLQLE